jgi:type II secretory pathway pseudopilin PulG
VIVVLAILAGVALPRYFDMSRRAKVSGLARDIKVISNAGWSYFRDTGTWAPDSFTSFPPELLGYMTKTQSASNVGTPLGPESIWDWHGPPAVSATGTLSSGPYFEVYPYLVGPPPATRAFTPEETSILSEVDQMIDDGLPAAGRIRGSAYFFNLP